MIATSCSTSAGYEVTALPILAIDLGTSNVKAAVVDRDGTLLGTGRGSTETIHSADGGAEQNAER
ncbi:MAG: hypothetical protein WCE62_00510, partial [Polyangiales bacterium]